MNSASSEAAASLSHPSICTIHEIDESEGRTFIAMECIAGHSLKEVIESGPLKLDAAIGEPLALLGYNSAFYDSDWGSAEREFRQAMSLTQNSLTVRTLYSDFLTITARHDEAFAECERAPDLNPFCTISGCL